jgi:AbrB family looped-hinge helix DNA binding protein
MSAPSVVRVDVKGRLTIPQRLRDRFGVEPGDVLYVEYDEEQQVLRYAISENLFDVLAQHALAEHQAGRTRDLRAFATENDIALDDRA